MTDNLRVRGFLVFLFLLFCAVYLLPNVTKLPQSWPLHTKTLNYGLDIEGGAHLVYGVDIPGILAERTERTARQIAHELSEDKIEVESVAPNATKDAILIKLKNEADRAKVDARLADHYSRMLQVLKSGGNEVEAKFSDVQIQEWQTQVVNQAIEVIRNRVDQTGTREPVIAAQGHDRILVQLPGEKDTSIAKALINKTAKLDFRLVDTTMSPEQVAKLVTDAETAGKFVLSREPKSDQGVRGLVYSQYIKQVNEAVKDKIPANTMIAFEKMPNAVNLETGKVPHLIRTDTDVSGDMLEDAFVSAGEFGEPKVSFRFNSEGKKKFGALTGANVGRQLAIVLDQVVYSAPRINERIDGEGQISLGSRNAEESQKEGQLIATALRAGALPAALTLMEERSVGPSLGFDSIEKGKRAAVIGILLVIVFVSFYYKMFGVVAAACLGLNVVGLLAVLSALGATLTLPGIAGVTLTVGMAVDANVIIYERIKEELRRGVSVRSAIRDGFDHAFSAIFDANVSTAIAASVLIYFGSGPVRGFGVTLIAGIVTTLITAVFVTRYFLDILVTNTKPSKYWI